jgi:hypothetical protein
MRQRGMRLTHRPGAAPIRPVPHRAGRVALSDLADRACRRGWTTRGTQVSAPTRSNCMTLPDSFEVTAIPLSESRSFTPATPPATLSGVS